MTSQVNSNKQRGINTHPSQKKKKIEEKEIFPNLLYENSITLKPKPKGLQKKIIIVHYPWGI